ncbi:MAG TPA: hypothetical protein PKX15_02175 [Bacteroidales bacterium]|nr:hypothetical protein [Bacteroidales bacterium]
MKKLSVLIILMSFCLVSCIIEDSSRVDFNIKNESSQEVKISIPNCSLDGGSVRKDTILSFPANTNLSYYAESLGSVNTFPFGRVDTAWIIFNNRDSVLYVYQNNSSKNILRTESYAENITTKKHQTNYKYTYIITETDYQNAKK